MNTPGPEMSVFTSVCAFPQKQQRYSRLATGVASASDMIFLPSQRQDDSQSCIDGDVNPALTRRREEAVRQTRSSGRGSRRSAGRAAGSHATAERAILRLLSAGADSDPLHV